MKLLMRTEIEKFWEFLQQHSRWVVIILLILGAFILGRIIKKLLNRFFERSSESQRIDPTNYKFFSNAVTSIIYIGAFIGVIYTIPSLRTIAVSLLASAGILAVILGLASQQAFSNIIGGIFIVIFKPFRVHDIITIGKELRGEVEDITLRHTVIRDFQNERIIIPNSVISSETIVNSSYSDQRIRRHIEFRVALDTDVEKAMEIIREEARAHPEFIDNRTPEDKEKGISDVVCRLVRFEENGMILRGYVWVAEPIKAFELHTDLNRRVKERFEQEGIEIPYPHRVLVKEKGKEG